MFREVARHPTIAARSQSASRTVLSASHHGGGVALTCDQSRVPPVVCPQDHGEPDSSCLRPGRARASTIDTRRRSAQRSGAIAAADPEQVSGGAGMCSVAVGCAAAGTGCTGGRIAARAAGCAFFPVACTNLPPHGVGRAHGTAAGGRCPGATVATRLATCAGCCVAPMPGWTAGSAARGLGSCLHADARTPDPCRCDDQYLVARDARCTVSTA